MLYNYYIIENSMSNFKDKINVCFYHSFYIYLKKYFPDLCDFETFISFKNLDNYYTSIEDFLYNYYELYSYLITINPEIKNILKDLVLGIALYNDNDNENNQVKIDGFIKLQDIIDYKKIKFIKKIEQFNKPIILLNYQDHFEPIMLY